MTPRLPDWLTQALAKGRALVPVRERRVRVLDAIAVAPGTRIAVVAFGERALLVSVGKTGVTLLAEDAL